ncbi:MAG: helix-turn-helix domain-containing protein [Pirellulaceae bacterium]|nr:helix-turn-helix domain-containing protein [Planctomycetales bacterium]MCB0138256.1 helix-turn-helix domain-containing protein [Caldilineaceae bacterium]
MLRTKKTSLYYSPPEVARRYGVAADKVRQWITRGELTAVNVGDATRPRWRVSPEALADFEAARAATPPPPPRRRRRSLPQVRQWV